VFDPSVLNPINFMQICILEHALEKTPQHKGFTAWLLKIYDKLGLVSIVNDLSKSIQQVHDTSSDALSCIRFSHFCDFGFMGELEQVCRQHKRYYDLHFNENKNRVVSAFVNRDFEIISDLIN